MKARVFEIVTNLYDENCKPLFDLKSMMYILEEKKSIDKYAWIVHDKDVDEKGNKKEEHIHLLLQMNTNYELSNIANWFNIAPNFIEIKKGRGAFYDCCRYLTHEDKKQQDLGKFLYEDDEVHCNFKFREYLDTFGIRGFGLSERDRLQIAVLKGEMTLKEVQDENLVLYNRYLDKFKKNRIEFINSCNPPNFRFNFFISGKGGYGKDLIATSLAEMFGKGYINSDDFEDLCFKTGDGKVALDGYDGQPVIIWSDVRACSLIQCFGRDTLFSGILEPFPKNKKSMNIKYGKINLINRINIFTSSENYLDFLNGLVGEYKDKEGHIFKSENKNQSYRRFPVIIPIEEDSFNLLLNKGYLEGNTEFSQFITYHTIRGNMAKVFNVSSEKQVKKLQFDLLKKTKDVIQIEVINKKENSTKDIDEDIEEITSEYKYFGEDITGLKGSTKEIDFYLDFVNLYSNKQESAEIKKDKYIYFKENEEQVELYFNDELFKIFSQINSENQKIFIEKFGKNLN